MTTPTSTAVPSFESTLVIAVPDVLLAGPKILLSATGSSLSQSATIPAWSQYFSRPASNKRSAGYTHSSGHNASASQNSPSLTKEKIHYSFANEATLLSITAAPPTTEQASHLCETIVRHAQASGTSRIILVAASNFVAQEQRTHAVHLHRDGEVAQFPAVPKGVPLGDHILSTFLTLLTFVDIPTTALVHPAKKGSSLRESQAVIGDLVSSLALVLGQGSMIEFSAEKAFQYSVSKDRDEESVEHTMYL
ncbi:hypothetical protein EDD11_000228 [Mortierella claussenii]|nr:hypothetical protein EDD11_000228 [Mortierella claussenii]